MEYVVVNVKCISPEAGNYQLLNVTCENREVAKKLFDKIYDKAIAKFGSHRIVAEEDTHVEFNNGYHIDMYATPAYVVTDSLVDTMANIVNF